MSVTAVTTIAATCQGAPRTCRCIETCRWFPVASPLSRQGAPRTCRCIETHRQGSPSSHQGCVREHHAPVGALRHDTRRHLRLRNDSQGAPRTCRCIETPHLGHLTDRHSLGQGAPRTCRCIETPGFLGLGLGLGRQGAPRTCRCIETTFPLLYQFTIASLTGAFVCAHIGIAVAGRCDQNSQRSAAPHIIPTHSNTVLPPGARPRCRRW